MHHTCFKLDHVEKESKQLYAKFDDYDKANDTTARRLFLCLRCTPLRSQSLSCKETIAIMVWNHTVNQVATFTYVSDVPLLDINL